LRGQPIYVKLEKEIAEFEASGTDGASKV